jgi:CysZ protein
MLENAFDSVADVFSPRFRRVTAKSLALTTAILALAWIGLRRLALIAVHVEPSWLATAISFVVGFGLAAALAFLAAPAVSLVAGLTFDEIAALVERKVDPDGAPGCAAPLIDGALAGLRFAGLSALVALVSLALLFVSGLGAVAWIGGNAYLLGRLYFELAALRLRPALEAAAMRRRHALAVFVHGLMIAGFVAVPLLNLLTPLFATALMARLHKRLARAG